MKHSFKKIAGFRAGLDIVEPVLFKRLHSWFQTRFEDRFDLMSVQLRGNFPVLEGVISLGSGHAMTRRYYPCELREPLDPSREFFLFFFQHLPE